MHLQLQYELGPASYVAHRRMVENGIPRAFIAGLMSWCALVAGVSLLGAMAAVMAQSLLLVIAFAIVLLAIVFHAASYRRHYEAAVSASTTRLPVRTVSLLIDEAGLHESVLDIQSFAPWSAVKSYALTSDTVLLELASGHWSLIPRSAFGSTSEEAVAPLIAVLNEKSIPKSAHVA